MTDREELIALLHDWDKYSCAHEQEHKSCDGCNYEFYKYMGYCREVRIADYLISKGVRIPVRCKECRYWWKNELCIDRNGEHFCAYGERKEQ